MAGGQRLNSDLNQYPLGCVHIKGRERHHLQGGSSEIKVQCSPGHSPFHALGIFSASHDGLSSPVQEFLAATIAQSKLEREDHLKAAFEVETTPHEAQFYMYSCCKAPRTLPICITVSPAHAVLHLHAVMHLRRCLATEAASLFYFLT